MIRKTALLAGVAGALMISAPAFAQDAETQPAPAAVPQSQATPTAAQETESAPAAAPAQLSLTAGSNVTGSDGVVLGQLQGAQTNAAGEQELTVKGSDGSVRAVPLTGLRQEGEGVVVGWSSAEFNAATPIATAPMTPDASDNASNVSGEADEPMATPTPSSDPTGENTPPDISGSTTPDMPAQPDAEPLPEGPQS
jgi:hypothetical protein